MLVSPCHVKNEGMDRGGEGRKTPMTAACPEECRACKAPAASTN